MWRELFHFRGDDAARRVFASAPDDKYFRKFRSAITLADAFIQEFEDALDLVDAVPLYYGTLWLGMAVAYVTLGPLDLDGAGANHGLKCTVISPFSLYETTVVGKNPRGACSLINKAFGGDDLMQTRFTLLDLLRAVPQLDDDLVKVNSETSALAFKLSDTAITAFDGTKIGGHIVASQKVTDGYLKSKLVAYEYLSSNGLTVNEKDSRIGWIPTRYWREELEQVCLSPPGGLYFLPKIGGIVMPEFTIYLMVLYTISNLVRYYPDVWVQMNDDESDEHFVIRSFIHEAKKNVPRLVLNQLTKLTNLYRTER